MGKTNTPEFGMAPTCEPVLHGPTRNPWDTARSTSGSSGGSAAAVAARMVPMAHGNDLGGSIRYPASACGLFGLKPTRARNPLGPEYGDAVSGWACEHALTRTVRDSAVLLDATAGPALGDPYGLPAPAPPVRRRGRPRSRAAAHRLHRRTPEGAPGPPGLRRRARRRRRAAAPRWATSWSRPACPDSTAEVGAAIGIVFGAATAWIIGYWIRRLGRRPADDELEPLTRAYWEMGQQVTAADYLLAIEDCQAFRPRCRAVPHRHRRLAHTHHVDPACADRRDHLDRCGAAPRPRSAAAPRSPTRVSSPTSRATRRCRCRCGGTTTGLPIGVHFLGRYGDEATLFRLAGQLECRPPLVRAGTAGRRRNRTARHGPGQDSPAEP